ncbi:hypothetical protein L593_10600 [Salinarchaeum sp. Harcht-Bsk1]|nr:hypothetical protein L593_10600 [Salinarchaeum sp. Harcht-Bsk1]
MLTALLERNPLDATDPSFVDGAFGQSTDGFVDPERARIAIHHTHLPKLEADGYVEWNPEDETIVKGPNWEEIAPLVELLSENEDEFPMQWA